MTAQELRDLAAENGWCLYHPPCELCETRRAALRAGADALDQLAALQAELAAWKGPGERHDTADCRRGPLCPYCEIARLREKLAAAEGERDHYLQAANAAFTVQRDLRRRAKQAEEKLAAAEQEIQFKDKLIWTMRESQLYADAVAAEKRASQAEGRLAAVRETLDAIPVKGTACDCAICAGIRKARAQCDGQETQA